MDPLSITASIAGLIGLVQAAVPIVQAIRREKSDAAELLERFERVEKNLESLKLKFSRIEKQFGQDADLYVQAKGVALDANRLKPKLKKITEKLDPDGRSKFDALKIRVDWYRKKKEVLEKLDEVLQDIRHLRDRLQDDDTQILHETFADTRYLKHEHEDSRKAEILQWICAETSESPLFPARAADLEDVNFTTKDLTYQQWISDASWQLNYYGSPGSGKSVRAQAVLANLRVGLPTGPPILSVFFHHQRAERQTLLDFRCSLLRQLLGHKSPVQIPEEVRELWSAARFKSHSSLDEAKAADILDAQLAEHPEKYLVVDAVDEAEACRDIISELARLRRLNLCIFSTDRGDRREQYDIVYCVNCRNGPLELYWYCRICLGDLQGQGQRSKFELCRECYVDRGIRCLDSAHDMRPPLKLNAEVKASVDDLSRYAQRFLQDEIGGGDVGDDDHMYSGDYSLLATLKLEIEIDTWDSLPGRIGKAADGNFLFAQLFLKRLKSQRHLEGLSRLLADLDNNRLSDLDAQYEDMLTLCLKEQDDDGAEVARRHLIKVSAAFEVLDFDQLSHATAIRHGDKTLRDFTRRRSPKAVVRRACNGLLSVEHSGKVDSFPVGFFHRSFTTYMDYNNARWFPTLDDDMFNACCAYLKLDAFSTPFSDDTALSAVRKEYPFGSYATCYWGVHAQRACGTVRNTTRILELVGDDLRLACAMQIAWHSRSKAQSTWDVAGGVTALHVCAFYGLEMPCRALLAAGYLVDAVDETHAQTPLMYACRHGFPLVVDLLLDAGADPNHLSLLGKTPVLEAIECGSEEILERLVQQPSIDVNARGTQQSARTALARAAEMGHIIMAQRLLACKGIDVNKADGWNCTALSRAVQAAQVESVRLLLGDDATNLSVVDIVGQRSALDWTVDEGIDNGENTNAMLEIAHDLMMDRRKPKPSGAAIREAIRQGKSELLQLFIDEGLDSSEVDEYARGFLQLAAAAGDHSSFELLYNIFSVESNFDIDRLDKYKATSLHAACRFLTKEGHVDTIRFLLANGSNPSLLDDQGFPPHRRAMAASSELWTSHVKALFGPYCTSAFLDDNGAPSVTLEATLRSQDLDAFDIALASLPDPLNQEVDPYDGCTILHRLVLLSEDLRLKHMTALLPRSSDFISAKDARGRTCAHYAVLQDSFAALKLLAEADIDMDLKDQSGHTAFELAQNFRRYEMCAYLAAKGVTLPSRSSIKPEILHTAVECGDLFAIKCFQQAGVDLQTRHPVTNLTALQQAEVLFEEAVQDANDALWKTADAATMKSADAFTKAKFNDPEVVKRQAIVDYLKQVQSRAPLPAVSPPPGTYNLAQVTTRLALLDDEKILNAADISPPARPAATLKSPSSDSLPPSYADAVHAHSDNVKHEQKRASAYEPGNGSLHIVNDVGPGLVTVLIVFAILIGFIAWLLAR